MTSKSIIPDNAKPGDAVLAHCPVCNELVYVLVLPGANQYIPHVMRQLEAGLAAHVAQTGHNSEARRKAKQPGSVARPDAPGRE